MSVNLGTAVGYLDLDTSKFKAGFSGATKALKGFASDAQNFSSRTKMIGNAMSSVGSVMTKTVTPAIVGVGAVVAKTGATFESAMSQVAATMGKSKSEIKDLEKTAIEMGSKTSFSATQAAEGLNYLALAGYTSEQQIAALPKVLNLAAAGNMELADASNMLTDAMSALGLASSDSKTLMSNMNTMVDQMAKTASKSNTSVAELGEGILTVGGTAKQLAGGTTELNTVLGLLADNGIHASEGGTHLRNILLAMQPTTDKAAAAFEKLGLKTYDAQGNLRPLEDIFYDLKTAMSSMTEEEKQAIETAIFNKTDLTAVNALLSTSTKRWNELSGAISESSGAADEMSKTQLDNLKGDFTLLGSAIEGFQIRLYNLANEGLRNVVQGITKFVEKLNNLSDAQLEVIEKVALFVASAGPVLVILGKILSIVSDVSQKFGLLKNAISSIPSLASLFSGGVAGATSFAGALAPIIAIIGGIVVALAGFKSAWEEDFGGIRENTENIVNKIKSLFTGIFDSSIGIVSKIKEAWENDFNGIRTSVEIVVSSIVQIISDTFDAVYNIVGLLKQAWENDFLGIRTYVYNFVKIIGSYLKMVSEYFSGVIKTISQLISGDFKGAMNTFKETVSKTKDNVKVIAENMKNLFSEMVKKIVSNIKELVTKAPENIKKAMEFMLNKIVEYAPKIISKILEIKTNIINKIKELITEMPYNIGLAIGYSIVKLGELKIKMASKASEAKEAFIEKIKTLIKDAPAKIKEAVIKMASVAKEQGISGLKNAAKNIVDGFINGITSKLKAVRDCASNFIKGFIDGAKKAADIHSPSKKMKKEVGEQLANGVIEGIKTKTNEGKKVASAYASTLVSEAKKGLKSWENIHGDIGAEQEVKYWKSIISKLKKGTTQYTSAYSEYSKSIKKLREQDQKERENILSNAEKRFDKYNVYNDMSLRQEVNYWDNVRKQLKKGTDERIEADKKYFEAKKKYNEQVKSLDEQYVKDQEEIYSKLNSDIDELNKKYSDAISSRASSILNAFRLFESYEKKEDVSSQSLIDSLHSQVSALGEYDAVLTNIMQRKIIPEDLFEEIKQMGVDALPAIKAINQMTDEQLEEYVGLWKSRTALATTQAERELEPLKEETQNKIAELTLVAGQELDKLRDEYVSSLEELGVDSKKAAKKAGNKTVNALKGAIEELTPSVVKSTENMGTQIISNLEQIANSVTVKVNEILESIARVQSASASVGAIAVSGSHKVGLDYVPYDGYVARLHKGEAVLTEEENRNRNGKSQGDTFIFNGTPPLDEKETARQFKLTQQKLAMSW